MSEKNGNGKKYTLTSMEGWGGNKHTVPVLIEDMSLEEAKRKVDDVWDNGRSWLPLSWWEYDVKDGAWVKEMCYAKDRTKRIRLVLAEVKDESDGEGGGLTAGARI